MFYFLLQESTARVSVRLSREHFANSYVVSEIEQDQAIGRRICYIGGQQQIWISFGILRLKSATNSISSAGITASVALRGIRTSYELTQTSYSRCKY